jgi:hypothetical protein
MRDFGILPNYCGCFDPVEIRQLPVHEDEIWPLVSSQCDRVTAVLGLTGSLSIVHNKNFLFHWPSHKVYGMSPAVDYPASIASNRDDHFSERRRSQ